MGIVCDGDCTGTFSAGTFSLSQDDTTLEWGLTATGTDWSVDSCTNYAASGGTDNPAAFTADCFLTS